MNVEYLKRLCFKIEQIDPNDDAGYDECCHFMADEMLKNPEETARYLLTSCTCSQLYWLSSALIEITDRTQNKKMTTAFRLALENKSSQQYDKEKNESLYMKKNIDFVEFQRSIIEDIEFAEGRIGLIEENL